MGISAYIPEEYVQDVISVWSCIKESLWPEMMKKIIRIKDELRDCYGDLPSSVENLLR